MRRAAAAAVLELERLQASLGRRDPASPGEVRTTLVAKIRGKGRHALVCSQGARMSQCRCV